MNAQYINQFEKEFHSGDFNFKNKPHGQPKSKVDNDELKAVMKRIHLKLCVN